MDTVRAGAVANVLNALLVVSGPEEGHVFERQLLASHVEGSVSSLVNGSGVVLYTYQFTSLPILVGSQVSHSVDVFIIGSHELVDYHSPSFV